MDIRIGDKIFGPNNTDEYKVLKFLGNGSFGVVFEVEGKLGEHYALKTIITASLDETNLSALINEGKLAMEIEHPNVIKVIYFHDGKEHPELPPYMIMELADNGTLRDLIEQRRINNSYFTNDEIRSMMLNLANGMQVINKKLVHRDIKPDNILFKTNIIKIADFGLSKIIDEATRTQTFKGIQNLMYAAPEAWKQKKNTIAMDIYSMGVVFYELVTLVHPYKVKQSGDIVEAWKNAHLLDIPNDPRNYNPSLDLGLSQMIIKMISKRSADRYNSWDEIILRIKNNINDSEQLIDINKLIEQALETKHVEELKQSKAEAETKKRKEQDGIVQYAFNDIVKAADKLIENFNRASDIAKLDLVMQGPLLFNIFNMNHITKEVKVLVNVVCDLVTFNEGTINAWGYVKAPSGRGFNLILTKSKPEDIYGSWITLHVYHSPLARKNDGRLEPFPFDLDELPKELGFLNAIHIYQTKLGQFVPELFIEHVKELL